MSDDWVDAAYDLVGYDSAEGFDWTAEQDLDEIIGEPPPRSTADTLDQRETDRYDAVIEGFREREKLEVERAAEATFSDHYVVLVFATKNQKDVYVRTKGWHLLGHGERFIDGRAVARTEKIDIPPDPVWKPVRREGTWDHMAMTVEENRALPEGST